MRASFEDAVDRIIDEGVYFVLLAGDLFHSRDVDAETLDVAESQLSRLKDENVEVIAVEGNHDAGLYREELSWMEYLHKKNLLTLLAADFDGDSVFRPPALDDEEVPGYVNCEGVRVFGVQYLGQRFTERIPRILEGIESVNDGTEPKLTVLLAHFGVSGQIPGALGVPVNKARKLAKSVDYVALGHFHRRFEMGSIHNPGSLEAHSRRQAEWERGFYFLDVAPEKGFLVAHESSRDRPYCSVRFDVGSSDTPSELKPDFESSLEKRKRDFSQPPVVSLTLEGDLGFSREELNLNWFENMTEDMLGALHVVVNDATESTAVSPLLEELESEGAEISSGQGSLDRDKLEGAVFERIAADDSRYSGKSEEVAGAMSLAKRMLLTGEEPTSVAEELKSKRRDFSPTGSEEGKE
ncbi:hypothetical protein AKJ41_00725 [candidate division MSBL1 archaeon SCGC-AAA259O05]|uniref:Calcineurin-like phosphoesterase domain-containing protein n=1 Tax=candidate division MSBL1 archaeon SCGC-AAA259O05 TaxID=1698271 RepID=A0A133V5E7_9EURY|nr:hypothetical protein AKJ41_00725 [candidate division MSBL1 archaeon SCGC-AAA259O05]